MLTIMRGAAAIFIWMQALDELVAQHLAADFKARFDIDALATPRSATRVRMASERVRRVLSANSEGFVSLECLVDGIDAEGTLSRTELEALAQTLNEQAVGACSRALRDAGLTASDLNAVELVGGYSRMPSFISAIRETLGIEPSRTLNAEESVARGAALAAAMRSRSFRMRPFRIQEGLLQPSVIQWEGEDGGAPLGRHELARGMAVPLQKRVTLRTRSAMHISWRNALGAAGDRGEVSCRVCLPSPSSATLDASRTLRVDVVIDENQLPSMQAFEVTHPAASADEAAADADGVPAGSCSASRSTTETDADAAGQEACEPPVPARQGADDAPGDVGEASEECALQSVSSTLPLEPVVVVQAPVPAPVPVTTSLKVEYLVTLGLSANELAAARELELQMQREDQATEVMLAAKNELEGEIYRVRAVIDEALAEFVDESEHNTLSERLTQLEDWLYSEGERQTAEQYAKEMDSLRSILAPLEARQASFSSTDDAMHRLEAECARLRTLLDARAHEILEQKLGRAQSWLVDAQGRMADQQRPRKTPAVSVEEVGTVVDELLVTEKRMEADEEAARMVVEEARAARADEKLTDDDEEEGAQGVLEKE